jgi:hypothetical protein
VPERACKAEALYRSDGTAGIVESPQRGESTCLVSRRSALFERLLVQIKLVLRMFTAVARFMFRRRSLSPTGPSPSAEASSYQDCSGASSTHPSDSASADWNSASR